MQIDPGEAMTTDYQPLATIEPAAARVSLARPAVLLTLVADLLDLAVDAVTALGLLGADTLRATVGPATSLGGDADQPIVARLSGTGRPDPTASPVRRQPRYRDLDHRSPRDTRD